MDLYAGALFLTRAMQWDGDVGMYLAIIVLLLVAAVFTIFGGLTAVIWTDAVQVVLMTAGSIVLSVMCEFTGPAPLSGTFGKWAQLVKRPSVEREDSYRISGRSSVGRHSRLNRYGGGGTLLFFNLASEAQAMAREGESY